MSWDEFAVAWSAAFDGYDPRHASAPKRRFLRAIHRITGAVRVKPAVTLLVSVACSVSVPLLAWRGGPWPTVGALMLVLGLVADAMSNAGAVRSGRVSRLDSFYQALVERFAELCWFVAFLAMGARLVPVVLCASAVWAHEYVRAKVGGAAMRRAGSATVGDRQVRVWFVLAALLLSTVVARFDEGIAAGVVTMVLLCWTALALIGLAQLVTIVRKVLAR